jgi:hypothetical protein
MKVYQDGQLVDLHKLSVEEFVAKYRDSFINGNCCKDIACSNCGNRDCFKVRMSIVMELHDDGTSDQVGDNEYDGDSFTVCSECGAEGNMSEFDIAGLDASLTDL